MREFRSAQARARKRAMWFALVTMIALLVGIGVGAGMFAWDEARAEDRRAAYLRGQMVLVRQNEGMSRILGPVGFGGGAFALVLALGRAALGDRSTLDALTRCR